MGSVQEALKAREERKKKEAESYQAKQDKINSAVEKYKTRMQNNSQSKVSNIVGRINSEIEAFKKVSAPTWGAGSLGNTLGSTRASRVNVSNLQREIESYKSYLDEETYNSLFSIVSKLGEGYDSYIKNAEVMDNFDSEDDYNAWYKKDTARRELESAKEAEDFDEYTKLGTEVANPDWLKAHTPINILGWKPFGEGETINNMVTFAETNRSEAFKSAMGAVSSGGGSSEHTELVLLIDQYMKDDEKAIYNYYVGKGDTEKANEYLSYIADVLRQRQAGKIVEKVDNTALEAVFSLGAGIESGFTGLVNAGKLVTGADPIPTSTQQYAHGSMSENNKGVWKVVNDLSYTTGNMTPSILAGTIGGPLAGKAVGSIVTGISSAGNSYAEMIKEGYGVDQARKYGIMVGTAEGGLSYLFSGISKVGGKLTGEAISKAVDGIDNGIARFFVEFAISSSSEALEEGAQTILDPVFKMIATGEDFEGIDWSEVGYSAMLGGLSAGLLEGVPNAAGAIHANYKTNVANGGLSNKGAIQAFKDTKSLKGVAEAYKTGKQAVTENAGSYVNEALEIDPDNAHAQRMKGRLDAGKNVSGYQINRLIEANESTLYKSDSSKIKDAVVNRLLELGEVWDIYGVADAITKQAMGAELTLTEKRAIKSSTYGSRVASEVDPANIGTGEYSNEWAETIGTEKYNVDEYNRGNVEASEASAPKAKAVTATNDTPVKENASEGEISASAEGANQPSATAVMSDTDGEAVNVKVAKIADVENGEASLELEGGQTVKASEVDFGDSGIGLVYKAATEMVSGVGGFNVDAANVMVKGFNPSGSIQAAGAYVSGFNEAYRYGAMGYPVSALETGNVTSKLSVAQREAAYNLGKAYGNEKVAEKQAKIDSTVSIKAGKDSIKATKKGKVYFDGSAVGKTLTERQKASLKGLRVIAEGMGINIHIFESKVVDGKRQGANGWYDPKDNSIHIDLHAGVDGNGLMLFTASHELTHHIREVAPAKFKVFADALLEEYTKHGVSLDELIAKKIEHLERNNRITPNMTEEQIHDLAYEEVVADSAEAMLVDSNAIEALSRKIQAKDKGLWETIKDFIAKLVARIKAAYEGLSPDSAEGKFVREMEISAEKLQKLWVDALLEASEVERVLGENGIAVNSETESASLYSVRDLLNSDQQEKVSKTLAERFVVTQAEAKEWLTAETSLASLILNPKYSQYLDYTADPNEEAIKSNSDYPQGTVDFSNICKKRRDFTEVMNRVLRNFPNHVFAATDLAKIRTIMEQEGMEVACAICYVEDRRQLDGPVAQDFIDSLELYRKGSNTRPDGKAFNANQLKALKLVEGNTYTPSIYELISIKGRNDLKAKNPAMEEAWVKFNNARGMQSVRLLLNDAEYKRQILKYSPTVVARKNDHGGLRIYSFSDMEMFHLIDIIQVITDSATVGLSLQGYTKVNEYAKAVKDTGEKLNRSLIPKGDLGYHMENGRVVLDFDTVEGIDINHPDFFDNIDNPNIGNIVIGINATQIRAAMASKFIDQIIPFHTGQSGEVLGEKGIAAWENYKDFQSERDVKTQKKSSHQINIYTEVINAAEAEGKPIKNKVDFVNKFLEVCKENNLIPRFSEFLNVDENGNYVYTEGYHKFLVDFKTFDQNTGEYLPQMPVKPIFDNEYLTKLLTDYVKSQKGKDAEIAKTMPKVIERITKEIVKPSEAKFSDRARNPYDGKVLYADSEVYDYSFLVSLDPMVVKTMPSLSTVKVDGKISQSKTVELGLKNAASIGKKVADDQYAIKNTYTKRDIIIGKGGLQHSLDASSISRLRTNARLSSIGGYIVQNAVPINGLNKENKQANGTYAMACLLNDGNGFVVAIVTVDEFSSRATKFDFVEITHSINGRFLAKKEDSRSSTRELELGQESLSTTAISEISIADFLEIVNSSHQSILSNDVLEHFGETRNPDGHYAKRVLFQDRNPDSYSNRSLLAEALETAAQNDIERQKLQQYKAKIDLINAEEQKLHDLRAQIKELSFAKGKRDTEAIKKLQFDANQAANRINTYDKQLLNLESTKALKGVLEREKALARKRDAQKYKEAQERYREKSAKAQRELMDRYQESRERATESRNKTAMRHKIKDITKELNTLLLNPTAKKHIKEELRKEVADALSAINMDTIGADERVAKYNYLIAKENDPDVIAELTKTRDNIQLQGEKLKDKLATLKMAYEKIKSSEDIELSMSYKEVIRNSIANVAEKVGDTPIRNMTLEQLEMVYELFSMIRTTIRDVNKTFKGNKSETNMQRAEAVNDQVRTVGGQPYKHNVITKALMKEGWQFLKPYVAFRTIGSITFTNLYKELRNGEDVFYEDVKSAQAFIEEQYEKHNYKSWDMKKTKTFTAKSGKTFDLTLEQMMSLYAYSRRPQAIKHIQDGGIVFEDAVITEKNKWGIPIKYEVTTKDAFNISEETLAEIANSLTAEQKAFVEAMQGYLSTTMGAKGNEVSMELLGVKLFKEEFYFPIKSSQQYMNFKPEEAGEIMLRSPAFSKETVPHADNPVVLHNFTDLWAEHINNMSMYHAFVLALEDFTKVYNYKTKTDSKVETMSTKATLETAYPGVTNYINKFLRDMNGGVRGETVGWAEKLTSLSKKGAVLGSWSVTIQQPSAVMRAMAVVNPKYFVTTAHKSVNLAKHKQDWAELKKYAPIAGIKEMGRFDVGMGQATVDWIKSNKTLMEKGEDILSAAPAYMDEVTWVSIWNAVKRETAHNNPTLKTSSDEFLKLAGERFTDVISLTQVYDSVFSRSDLMRNKSWIAKAVTAFMAEPTTTLNMIWDSLVQGKRSGSAKGFVKANTAAGSAIAASIVFNAALKSIIMAMRDDDEDESYAEKYLERFFGDLKDNLNPLTLVPYVKDVVSIFKGYDAERMDMAAFADLKDAMDAFDSKEKTEYEKWSGLIGATAAFFGMPIKNVERDFRGLLNTVFSKTEDTTEMGILNAIEEGWTGKEKSNGQQLYEAMVKGDSEQIERVKGRFENQTAINSAIRKALRENDPRIKEAAEARYNGDIAEYMKIAKAIIAEGNFKQDDVVAAINSEINAMKPNETSTPSDKVVSLYSVGDYYTAIMSGKSSVAYAVREDLIQTDIANGKDRDEAEDSFNSKLTSHIREQYEAGDITDHKAKDMLSYAGKTDEEAASKVQYWNFKKQYPDSDLGEEAVKKYYNDVEPSGISIEVYEDYSKQRSKAKGEDLNGDGKADSGSVKSEVMQIIHSLPISSYQKDALYFLNGWSQSTLWEAPWH